MTGSGRTAGGTRGHDGRKPLVIGNWKMHGGVAALTELRTIDRWAAGRRDLDIAFALPAPPIMPAAQTRGAIAIGAQDVHRAAERAGVYGERIDRNDARSGRSLHPGRS